MKKIRCEYEKPILSIVTFEQDDVIRTSGVGGGGFGGEEEDFYD